MVHKPSWRGHQNIEAEAKGADLWARLGTPNYEPHTGRDRATEALEGLGDLGRELAGGGEDKMGGRLGHGLAALFKALKNRQGKGGGLAGTGLGNAQ